MKTEFEATFIDVDVQKVRERLQKIGAKNTRPETLMRRVVFLPPQHIENGWMRVRDEGDKITLSLKQIRGDKIEDQKEIELVISSFDAGVALLKAIGASQKAYQETRRESWVLGDTQIEIDTWPGLDPFVEIESTSEQEVQDIADQLGFDYTHAIFGSVERVYEMKLGIPPDIINNHTPEITFENPPTSYTSG